MGHGVCQDIGARERLRRHNRGALSAEWHDTTDELRQKRRGESVGAVHDLVGSKVPAIRFDDPLVARPLDRPSGRVGLQVEPVLVDAELKQRRDELVWPERGGGKLGGCDGTLRPRTLSVIVSE